jgi:nitrate/nitrite transporter NarK
VLTCSNGAVWQIVIFVVLFSFADGINSVSWALVGDFFGRKQFATIRGWIGMIQSLASMPAAVFTGWVYDRTQSYTYALLPFIAFYGLGAVVLWQASRPKRPERLAVATSQALETE